MPIRRGTSGPALEGAVLEWYRQDTGVASSGPIQVRGVGSGTYFLGLFPVSGRGVLALGTLARVCTMCGPTCVDTRTPVDALFPDNKADTYDPAPGLTLSQIRAKIPSKCFEK
eukprot:2775672-Pyramimonas_sp.AAC.1